MYFSELESITGGKIAALQDDKPVLSILTDSRKPVIHESSVFFAFIGERNDGHEYIQSLYNSGIHQFVVEKDLDCEKFPMANILRVSSTVDALQKIAAHRRAQFSLDLIAITGSNGKTIIKEWLHQLLSPDKSVIKNPGSYNSQIGVPLSVWQIQTQHQVGIFEAGISMAGEMSNLQKIIRPTMGVFANIGTAHDENFPDRKTKIAEKLKLFEGVRTLVYCTDHTEIHSAVRAAGIPSFCWGKKEADVIVTSANHEHSIEWNSSRFSVVFPFTDTASIENALHCIAVMVVLGYPENVIRHRIQNLRSIPMRLELKEGVNHCLVIDDTYNNDLGGLQISLDFLKHQHQKKRRILILSDILQSGLSDKELARQIAGYVNKSGVSRFFGIGPILFHHRELFSIPSAFFKTTDDFLHSKESDLFYNETILVKGARKFTFEKIAQHLQKKVHGTVMEVNLGSLVQNLNFFKSKLKPTTKVMVMVKAFAYGSGSVEIANILQYHQVDYLGVAYADEGVELRKNNITTPIMVMNPSAEGFQSMVLYNLEPEIYNTTLLEELISFLNGKSISIHLKLETGMNRLGFDQSEIDQLVDMLSKNSNIQVVSIFSHLVGSDSPVHDDYSNRQVEQFLANATRITDKLKYRPLLHILNTSGILRLPQFQLDMVRLGIGLYGVNPTDTEQSILPVATLKSVISQIKLVSKGQTVGYGRKGVAQQDMRIATIAIGYADGYSRAFSQGVGEVVVNGKKASVFGNVCMDMTMIDISEVDAKEGDEVIIFGKELPIQEVANRINTIPYEILTNTSERVKRIFVAEGI